MTKFEGTRMGVPQMGPKNFKLLVSAPSVTMFAHAVFVFQNVFSKRKTNEKDKAAILTTTLSAERTLYAISKNYTIKTIPAGKILERNLLDR